MLTYLAMFDAQEAAVLDTHELDSIKVTNEDLVVTAVVAQ